MDYEASAPGHRTTWRKASLDIIKENPWCRFCFVKAELPVLCAAVLLEKKLNIYNQNKYHSISAFSTQDPWGLTNISFLMKHLKSRVFMYFKSCIVYIDFTRLQSSSSLFPFLPHRWISWCFTTTWGRNVYHVIRAHERACASSCVCKTDSECMPCMDV